MPSCGESTHLAMALYYKAKVRIAANCAAKSTLQRLLVEQDGNTRFHGLIPTQGGQNLSALRVRMIIRDIVNRVGCSHDMERLFLLTQDECQVCTGTKRARTFSGRMALSY